MPKTVLYLFLSLISVSALAENKTTFEPQWSGKGFLAHRPADLELPADRLAALLRERAQDICVFLQRPEGRFRRRSAGSFQTGTPPEHNGSKLAVVEKSGSKLRAKLVKIPKGERAKIFRSLQCVGTP